VVQVPIKTNASDQEIAFIEENQSKFPSVHVVEEAQRIYPHGDLAGQVLGYVGRITAETKKKYVDEKKYLATQIVGITGLESQYEDLLQGKPGAQVVEINAAGIPLKYLGYAPQPTPGKDLQLTLDGHLQAMAQQYVMDGVLHSQNSSTITDAEAVMLDVKTGGVLAMVSYPYYDPNWYVNPSLLMKHGHYLATSGAQLNNVIQSPRYPGSTVKPANLIIGLQKGVITPGTVMADHYTTLIGKTPIHDDGQHGSVDPIRAIAVSCDTFFYEVGLWLGKWFGSTDYSGGGPPAGTGYETWLHRDFVKGLNALYQGEYDFGLGQKTGIDLPGERSGIFYVRDSRKQYAPVEYHLREAEDAIAKHNYYLNYGTPADLAHAGIGQAQQFTPIELAQYVMTIANNGKKLQPHLLERVFPPNTRQPIKAKPTAVFHPVVQGQVKAKLEYFRIAQQGMYNVVNSPEGTAYGVFAGAPYTVAGKTGTAQIYINGRMVDNSVFICYAPFDHPEVALAVMVPGGGYGAGTAAPIARKILDAYFQEYHHELYPKNQWQSKSIPANWQQMTAYTTPENAQ
jgi:penicillin-binding protein 2